MRIRPRQIPSNSRDKEPIEIWRDPRGVGDVFAGAFLSPRVERFTKIRVPAHVVRSVRYGFHFYCFRPKTMRFSAEISAFVRLATYALGKSVLRDVFPFISNRFLLF